MSSLTLSCFDRQRTCILVQSLVGDDRAAPCAAHTRQSEKGSSFDARFQDFKQPVDCLPRVHGGWIKQRPGPRRCQARMAHSSGPSHFSDGAFLYLGKIINKDKKGITIEFIGFFLYLVAFDVLHHPFFSHGMKKVAESPLGHISGLAY